MEIPAMPGILRKSPELGRWSLPSDRDESCPSTAATQDKVSVRFFMDDIDARNMNTKLLTTPSEKVRFSYDRNAIENVTTEDNDEDYSASVNAILQRRASSKRRKRRSSSPFSHEDFSAQSTPRRRSSGFTITSIETSPSVEETAIKEEQIYENIRLHKEVITNVKQQPWPIHRKLKLLQKAKAYVKRHEGELQVRLKQSRSTKDILTRFNILIIKKWQHTKREVVNFMNLLIPWELRIKEIESHFGTVVASYFTFLRWLFWVNLVTSIILTAFVIVPEILLNKNRKNEDGRKELLPNEKRITLDMLLNFEGVLKHSPIFYGYYSNREEAGKYKIPTAYFMIGIGVYIYCFIAILRKMAVNFRLSKLSEKEDECIFTWKLFTGWDYMIGNAETGHNRTSSIVLGFKEALLEEAEKKKEKQSWKVISIRVFVNLNVLWMLIFSARTVIYVVNKSSDRQENINENDSAAVKWWKQNETTVVMTVIGSIFPFIFELFGLIEKYHPRKTLRIQLGRIMALNLLNLYTLTFALFNQIGDMNKELDSIRKNISNSSTEVSPFNDSITSSASQNLFHVISIDEYNSDSGLENIFSQVRDQINPQIVSNNLMFHASNDSCCATNDTTIAQTPAINDLKEFLKRIDAFTDPAQSKYPKPIEEKLLIGKDIHDVNNSMVNMTENELTTASMVYTDSSNISLFANEFKSETVNDILEFTETTGLTTENDDITDIYENTASTVNYSDDIYVTNDYGLNGSEVFSRSTEYYNVSENVTETTWVDFGSNFTKLFFTTLTAAVNETESTESNIRKIVNLTTIQGVEDTTVSLEEKNITTNLTTHFTTERSKNRNITAKENLSVLSTKPIPDIQSTQASVTCKSNNQDINLDGMRVNDLYDDKSEDLSTKIRNLEPSTRQKLRRLCWETMFGQELVKLTIMDLAENIMSTFCGDFVRALLVRYLNKIWCWDLEKKFPKYADFKIAENILHLVNNQGLVWMGMFFSPGLPLINVVKLMIMMYLRSWAVLTCNVPHEVVFRASRSNNFYLALLLTMLFLCVLPVCYAIVWLKPSWHCGPFSNQKRIYIIFVKSLKNTIHPKLHIIMDYMASPGTVIPLIIILLLIIYYLASLTSALREANVDLKVQLRRERTEERKKMFQMASRRKRGGSDMDSTFAKWKKILQEVPSTKLSDETAFPDFLDDKKADDTDVDIGLLRHDEEEKQKIKKIFRSKAKTESANERKWGNLLKMVPKNAKEPVDRGSTSTTSSLKDDSVRSENIPEIKISRVQTLENLMKAEKIKRPETSTIEEEMSESVKVFEKLQRKSNLREIGKTAKLDSDSDNMVDLEIDEPEDDVFLESVVVDVPEMAKISESISNRIKRRLRKVLSMASNEENQPNSETSYKNTRISIAQSTLSQESDTTNLDVPKSSLSEKDKRILEYRRSKLVKSESMNMERDMKWKNCMQRRKSSLDELHFRLPDV